MGEIVLEKARTLEEWADIYEKKTGEKLDRNCKPTFYFPDKGFGVFSVSGDMIIIHHVCGDGVFWRQIGEVLALERGLHKLGAICIRKNIKAYLRCFEMKITDEEILSDGKIRYFFKHKYTKKQGRATPTDDESYLITWEV